MASPADAPDRSSPAWRTNLVRLRSAPGLNSLGAWLLATLWVAGLFAATLPTLLYAQLQEDPLDASWELGLAIASSERLQWGKEVIFTYGPLGFLGGGYDPIPQYWELAAAAGLLVQLVLLVAVAVYLAVSRAAWPYWLVAGILLSLPATFILQLHDRADLAGVVLLLAGLHGLSSPLRRAAALAAGGTLLAFAGLVSDRALALGALLLSVTAVVLLADSGPRWLASVGVSTFGVVALALWWGSGQQLDNIDAYLRSSIEIVSGYSAAMYLGSIDTWVILCGVFTAALGIAGIVAWLQGAHRLRNVLLLTTPVAFGYFKEAFGRSEAGHQLFFTAVIPLILLLVLLELRGLGRTPTVSQRGTALVVAAAIGFFAQPGLLAGEYPPHHLRSHLRSYLDAARWVSRESSRTEHEATAQADLRQRYQLPQDVVDELRGGTVDVFPYEIVMPYAYQLRWSPRPVLAAYAAYTPHLDHADASHLSGPGAPDFIVYQYSSIDARYPAYDEPETWRTMLNSYSAELIGDGRYVLLRKRADAPPLRRHGLGSACASFGSEIAVPARPGEEVFAALTVPYSLKGRLVGLALKPGPLAIQLSYGAGAQVSPEYRLVEAVAGDGIYVSNFIVDNASFAKAANGQLDVPIHSLRVTTTVPGDYSGQVCATFFSLLKA